jgi:hypothetical protein
MKGKFIRFFTSVDYPILGKSCQEVIWMTLMALFPLIINIIIATIPNGNFTDALLERVIPGEILSYCLSFIAPSLYLLTKIQGTGYKLPLLHTFSIITLLIYVSSLTLYLITKNHWMKEITMEQKSTFYFKLTLVFLLLTVIFRVYSIYHGRNMSNWSNRRQHDQEDFNTKFTQSINS